MIGQLSDVTPASSGLPNVQILAAMLRHSSLQVRAGASNENIDSADFQNLVQLQTVKQIMVRHFSLLLTAANPTRLPTYVRSR